MSLIKTWQMIKALSENPKLIFKNNIGNSVKISSVNNSVVWEENDKESIKEQPFIMFGNSPLCDNLHINWELAREPVDFLTAANSGKGIKPDGNIYGFNELDNYLRNGLLNLERINGKWLVE